jgi:hypothetical protein
MRRKQYATNSPLYLGLSPEFALVFAVYLQARRDLLSGCEKWRRDAERFFEEDGWDVKRIRDATSK